MKFFNDPMYETDRLVFSIITMLTVFGGGSVAYYTYIEKYKPIGEDTKIEMAQVLLEESLEKDYGFNDLNKLYIGKYNLDFIPYNSKNELNFISSNCSYGLDLKIGDYSISYDQEKGMRNFVLNENKQVQSKKLDYLNCLNKQFKNLDVSATGINTLSKSKPFIVMKGLGVDSFNTEIEKIKEQKSMSVLQGLKIIQIMNEYSDKIDKTIKAENESQAVSEL